MIIAFPVQQEYTRAVPALPVLLVHRNNEFDFIRRNAMTGHDLIASLAAGILGALGILVPAVMAARSQRRKDEESREESVVHQWIEINKALKEQSASMEAQMDKLLDRIRALEEENIGLHTSMAELEEKNRTLTAGVRTLVTQIRQLGHEPDWEHTD